MTALAAPHLRPLGLGQLLDQAIRLYRHNFLKFIGIIAIVQIPLTLLQLLVSLLTFGDTLARLEDPDRLALGDPFAIFTPSYFIGVAGGFLVAILSFVLIQGVATAALTRTIAGSYLGETTGIPGAYRRIGRSWLSLLGALVLAILVGIGLGIWLLIPCIGWVSGPGMLFFFGIVVVPLIAPVVVLENQGAFQSLRRAWELARRRFWWVLGFVFVLFLFGQLVITGPTALVGLLLQFVVGDPLEFSASQATIRAVTQSLVQLIFSLIYLPLQLTGITLMYFDLRVRTEGFDLTLLAETMSGEPADVATVMAQAAPLTPGTRLLTLSEAGYFVLVSIGAVVLYSVLAFFFGMLGFALMAASGGLP